MRLNNRARAGTNHLIATLLLAFLVGGCLLFLLAVFRFQILNQWAIAVIILPLVLFVIFYLGAAKSLSSTAMLKHLLLKNSNVFPLGKALNDEFSKYKMLHFLDYRCGCIERIVCDPFEQKEPSGYTEI